MPKATLQFNLPEEQQEFEYASNGTSYSCVISEMDNYLRAKLKYEDLSEEIGNVYQEVRDKLNELCNEYNVSKF